MRYFLIGFGIEYENAPIGMGEAQLQSECFLNKKHLENELRKTHPDAKRIVIMNIYEFKNEEDYKIYNLEI